MMMCKCPCGRVQPAGMIFLCYRDCGNVVCTHCAKRYTIEWIICAECTNDGGD